MIDYKIKKNIIIYASVCLVLMIVTRPSLSRLPDSDRVLDEQRLRCGERDLVVWGKDEDIRLDRGDERIVAVEESQIVLICGRKRIEIDCHPDTREIWVKRSSDRDTLVVCLEG